MTLATPIFPFALNMSQRTAAAADLLACWQLLGNKISLAIDAHNIFFFSTIIAIVLRISIELLVMVKVFCLLVS